jgi:hypothetical protein
MQYAMPGPAGQPCWKLVEDAGCPASGQKVEVDRGGAAAPDDMLLDVNCLTLR